jgi:hypothetical protein
MDFSLTQEQQALIDRVDWLGRQRIAPRAAGYDENFEAPVEDLEDLHREGWLLAKSRQTARRSEIRFTERRSSGVFPHRRAPRLRQPLYGALLSSAQQRADDDRRHGRRAEE